MATASRALAEKVEVSWGIPVLSTWGVIIIVDVVMIIASLVFLSWFRKQPIVAMGQPWLLFVMRLGSLLYLSGLIIEMLMMLEGYYVFDGPWHILCGTANWLLYIGMFMTDSMIFFKLYQVYKVTQFRRSITVLPRHILFPFLFGLIVPLAMCIVEQAFFPSDTYSYEIEGKVYYACGLDITREQKIITYLHLAIALLFRLAILIFAWKLRKLDESIGDSRRIMRWAIFTIMAYIFAIVFFFRILKNLYKWKALDGDTRKGIGLIVGYLPVLLNALAPTMFLVVPRMYLVWYEGAHGRLPANVQMYGSGRVNVSSMPNLSSTIRSIPSRQISSSIADEAFPPEEIKGLEDENENKVEDDRDSQIAKDNAANV